MRAITIRDHQQLKEALVNAIADYKALPQKTYRFLASPGEEGKARAEFVSQQLSAIHDLSSPAEKAKLEILFAAIIESDIYKSTIGRLRNLILTHLVAKEGKFHFERGVSCEELDLLDKSSRALCNEIRKHAIFENLEQYASYRSMPVRNVEGIGADLYIYTFMFSRTEALRQAAKDIMATQRLNDVCTLAGSINRALQHKKAQEKAGTFELQNR